MGIHKLKPALKPYLWGGEKLKEKYHVTSDDKVAEIWAVSAHPDGPSLLEDGTSLIDYLNQHPEVLGKRGQSFDKFPILIKILGADKDLSIQVHPDDEYGLRVEKEYGKNEMWLVLESEPDASIYYGVKETMTKDEYRASILNNTILEKLNLVKTKPYDFFYVPANTIHALNKGNVIAEIQQSSNSTYRIYDYNRPDKDGKLRELHIDKAVDVSNLNPIKMDKYYDFSQDRVDLIDNEFFKTVFYRVQNKLHLESTEKSFQAMLVIKGSGVVSTEDKQIEVVAGNGIFIDAKTAYEVEGQLEIVIAEV